MAKKITNSEVIADDFLVMPLQKAKEFLVIIKDIESAIKVTAKASKDNLGGKNMVGSLEELRKTKKAIEEINVLTEKALKIRTETMKVEAQIRDQEKRTQQQSEKVINEQIKNQRELLRLEQEKIKLQNLKRKEEDRKAKEERLTNALKVQVKTLQQLQDRNSALIKVRKSLDLTTEEGIKDYRRFTAEIKKNNAVLSQHDAAIGSYVRNVGNYSSAVKGFGTQLLGILGAGSFLAIAQNAIQATAEFDQSMADLKAITGATDEQMKFFRDTAIEQTLSMEGSTASAKDYTEALKLIASAKPELLENATALKEITDQALILADASGLELPDAATRLTDAMNQFGAGSEQAGKFVDVLAAAAKYGSAEIPQITEALLEFGPVAKSYNVSIQESAAAIEGLAEKGIKGSEAGTKFRNVLLALGAAKGLPKEAQESFERVGIDVNILADNSLTLHERLTELNKAGSDEVAMLKIFGKENISAAKTVLAQKDRIAELTTLVDENGVALEQAGIRTNTMAGEWKKLGNAWQSEMIKMSRSTGDMAGWIRFLRENLETIINVVGRVIRGFIVYKTTLGAINLITATARTINAAYASSMVLLGKGTKGADGAMKGLNATMKANIIAIVAIAVIELADALDLFTSKAEILQRNLDNRLDSLETWGAKNKEAANQELQTAIELNDKKIRLAQSEGATEEQIAELRKKGLEEQANIAKEYRAKEFKAMESYAEQVVTLEGRIAYEKAKYDEMPGGSGKSPAKARKRSQKEKIDGLEQELKEMQGSYKIQEKLVNDYDKVIENSNLDTQIITNETNQAITQSTKVATESQIAEWKRKVAEIKRVELELRNWLADLQASNMKDEQDRDIAMEELRFQRELEKLKEKNIILGKTTAESMLIEQELKIAHREKLKEIDKKYSDLEFKEGLEDLEFKYRLMEDEAIRTIENQEELDAKLMQLKIDQTAEELLMLKSNLASEEEILEKQLELDRLLREQKLETAEKIKKANESAVEAMKSGLKGLDDELKKQEERNKDLISAAQTLSDELTKIFTDASKKREEILDKEIEHSKNRQDQLRAIAENGVLEANQSLAAEERKQAELERKKLAEQKKQQRIELANTAFKAYVGHVDNKDTSPLTSTIRDITALTAFISSLPAFYEGTENTGKGGKLDDKGGFTAVLHPNERVMTAEQNKELKGLSNDDVVRVVRESQYIKTHSSDAVNNVKMADAFAMDMAWQTNEKIVEKVDELIKTVENKPVPSWDGDAIAKTIIETIKKGNNTLTNHYKLPNING